MGLFVPIHELIEPIDVPDFNALYREHYRNIYALIFKIVKQKEATEDILQQVYLELWENRENLSPEEISEWLLSNGFTTAMNYLKSRKLENNYIFEQAEKLEKGTGNRALLMSRSMITSSDGRRCSQSFACKKKRSIPAMAK